AARQALPVASSLARSICRVRFLVGQASNLVINRIINDTMGIVSHDPTLAHLWRRLAALAFTTPTRPHLPSVIRHPASAICHPPFLLPHSPFRIPHSAFSSGKILVPPVTIPNGTFAWFANPEGNTIGLWTPAR